MGIPRNTTLEGVTRLGDFSSQESVLTRFSQQSLNSTNLTSTQAQVDLLVSRFVEEASSVQTLAAIGTGSLFYRFGRLGTLALASRAGQAAPLLQAASYGVGLASEVTAFQGVNDFLSPAQALAGRSYWERWRTSFVQFGLLKMGGGFAAGQNAVVQHAFQDAAMVAGHQVTGQLGWTPPPEGSLAEQLLHAEVTNLQLGAGMSWMHTMAPGAMSFERSLDLSLRAREKNFTERPSFSLLNLSPAPAFETGTGSHEMTLSSSELSEGKPLILQMSISDSKGGGGSAEASRESGEARIFSLLGIRTGRRGNAGAPTKLVPRQSWEKPNQVNVNESGVSEGGTLFTTGLTSCTAVLLYDPIRKVGAMIHIQPPVIQRGVTTVAEIRQLMDEGMERTLDLLGGERKNITAITIRSGLDLPDFQDGQEPEVTTHRWSEQALGALKERGILVRDLPLHDGVEEIRFDTGSGKVEIDYYKTGSSRETGPRFRARPFETGVVNSTEAILELKEINGQSVDVLERRMRPGASSTEGFLGENESLLRVMAEDNDYVLSQGLTHRRIALELGRVEAAGQLGLYRGRRFAVKGIIYLGSQESPFRDGDGASMDLRIVNLDSGKSMRYSTLLPAMIAKYGFYEGRETPYRLDPRQILEVLDFLRKDAPLPSRAEGTPVERASSALLDVMVEIKELQEEKVTEEKMGRFRTRLARLKESVARLTTEEHESVLKNLENNWFLNTTLMSAAKAMFWMSSLDHDVAKNLNPEDSPAVLQGAFAPVHPAHREELGTLLMLKALQPLFDTHPHFMDEEFSRQMNDFVIL